MPKPEYIIHNYIFRCDKCHFITDNKKDYRRHTESAKHFRMTKVDTSHAVILPISEPNTQDSISNILPQLPIYPPTPQNPPQVAFIFEKHIYKYCEKCGNKYCSRSGLWKHKKTCNGKEPSQPIACSPDPAPAPVPAPTDPSGVTAEDLKTIMFDMFKNNQEFQNKLIEMMCNQQSMVISAVAAATAAATSAATAASSIPNNNNYNGPTNSINNSNNNNNNNTFNLQFFLNEHCKDAMNINEFANTISLKDDDLLEFGRMGYVQGMSKLFIDSLKNTDVCKRPIHCSDARRETLYVKDADKWERDDAVNTKITKAVRVVEHKNIILVNEWAKQNPKCEDSSTYENAQYINMSRAVLDGDDKNIAKVIKMVAKEVVIEKP
jgi:hypothetical protein